MTSKSIGVRLAPALAPLLFQAVRTALSGKDDAALVRRLRARDPKAMSDLYNRYGRLVYSLIFRIVRDTAAAEDLTQETFLRVWNRVHALDAALGSLGPWIVTVARNRAIDHLRSADGRFAARAVELAQVEYPGNFTHFDDSLLSIDRARLLKEAFEKLTPSQKTVIELAYYEGLSQTEMAERMQQPLGTVKTWVRSALKTLRDQLAGAAVA
jgi:RNA polymerase sigma-70 factor (ECF subfamily)